MAASNLAGLLASAAADHPDKIALIDATASTTWADLDRSVTAAAAALRGRGLSAGDRVGLLLPNDSRFVVAYLAVLRADLVAVPLNTAYTGPELDNLLSDASAALVVTAAELQTALDAGAVSTPRLVLAEDGSGWNAPAASTVDDARRGGEDLAVLLYTSGTTGRLKGAMLSHRALLANLDQLAQIEPAVVAPDDRVLLVLPLFHVYGLNAGLGMVLKAGATAVLGSRFDPVETLDLVRQHEVTNLLGAPPMYVAWSMLPEVGDAFAGVRLAVSGAAPLPPTVLESMRDATGREIYEGYGLTEAAPVVTSSLCGDTVKPGSIGRPIPGVELVLLDESGDEVEEDDPGEIVVRGPNLFSGYWPDGA